MVRRVQSEGLRCEGLPALRLPPAREAQKTPAVLWGCLPERGVAIGESRRAEGPRPGRAYGSVTVIVTLALPSGVVSVIV